MPNGLGATRYRKLFACAVLLLSLAACAAAGVPETNDPYKKLAQSDQMERSGRIAIAQRLLLQSIEIFEQGQDTSGLAEAYRRYGFYLRTYGVETVLKLDPSAAAEPTNEDGRMDKAIVFFQKSLMLAEANGAWDLASNLQYNIGVSHYHAGRRIEACRAFDESLSLHERADQANAAAVDLPAGFSSYAELIAFVKEDNQCP